MLTLDYFKTHPLRIPKDQRFLTIGQVRATEKATVHPEDMHPTAGAYIHYGGVELADMLVIAKPDIPADKLQQMTALWYQSCGRVCKQLLFYTWLICAKEMRHGSSGKCDKAFFSWPDAIKDHMGPAMDLCKTISNGGSYEKHLDAHGHIFAGPYMEAVERQFRHGGWGGAYGGPKWADIALEIVRYFNGESSAMLAADRCWTLVHNTGPIFNKGFYFEYHDSKLIQVLNAQASTSVFTLGDPHSFLQSDSDYHHEVSTRFQQFAALALEAIQTVKPDYTFGSGGAVNSDGTKTADTGLGNSSELKFTGKGTIHFGPFAYKLGQHEEAVQ